MKPRRILAAISVATQPCPEPAKAEHGAPVFCYHTLTGTECYAEENPFGLKLGWLRPPISDIGG
jgi:hypothetical protein